MDVVTLGARTLLCTMLVVAGAAKLSDVASFSATIRLFMPHRARRVARSVAFGVIGGELALGAAGLSLPSVRWLHLTVFAATFGFLGVSIAGFLFLRDRPCKCFGALSARKFDGMGVVRGLAIVAVGALSIRHVPPSSVRIGGASSLMLLIVAAVLAAATYAAATAVALTRRSFRGLTA